MFIFENNLLYVVIKQVIKFITIIDSNNKKLFAMQISYI